MYNIKKNVIVIKTLKKTYKKKDKKSYESLPLLLNVQNTMNTDSKNSLEGHVCERRLVYSYFLARKPLACAWKAMMTTVIFRSLSSSSWASTPVRKKILLCPILYRLGSKSRCLIYTDRRSVRKRSLTHSMKPSEWTGISRIICIGGEPWTCVFTIRQQACLPSMKPLGIALAARIS